MSPYAIMGATGQVGGSVLEVLLQSPEKKIHAHVRSKRKLLIQRPDLASNENVTIFEGQISDIETLTACIRGTRAIFAATAASDNIPGCDIAQKQAKSVVQALEALRKESSTSLPQLIVLSSASLEDSLLQDLPWFAKKGMKMAASYVYADLRLAEIYLRSHEWIKQVYMKPGGLSHDSPKGHVLSTEKEKTFLSFLDLAGGMVEVADADSDKYDMKNVSVQPAADGTRFEWGAIYFASRGLMWHFLPWTYPYLSPWLP